MSSDGVYVPNKLRGVMGGSNNRNGSGGAYKSRLKGRKSRPWRVDAASWKQELQERKAVYDHFALPEADEKGPSSEDMGDSTISSPAQQPQEATEEQILDVTAAASGTTTAANTTSRSRTQLLLSPDNKHYDPSSPLFTPRSHIDRFNASFGFDTLQTSNSPKKYIKSPQSTNSKISRRSWHDDYLACRSTHDQDDDAIECLSGKNENGYHHKQQSLDSLTPPISPPQSHSFRMASAEEISNIGYFIRQERERLEQEHRMEALRRLYLESRQAKSSSIAMGVMSSTSSSVSIPDSPTKYNWEVPKTKQDHLHHRLVVEDFDDDGILASRSPVHDNSENETVDDNDDESEDDEDVASDDSVASDPSRYSSSPPHNDHRRLENWSIRTVPSDEMEGQASTEVEKSKPILSPPRRYEEEPDDMEDDVQSYVTSALLALEKATKCTEDDDAMAKSELMASAISAIETAAAMAHNSANSSIHPALRRKRSLPPSPAALVVSPLHNGSDQMPVPPPASPLPLPILLSNSENNKDVVSVQSLDIQQYTPPETTTPVRPDPLQKARKGLVISEIARGWHKSPSMMKEAIIESIAGDKEIEANDKVAVVLDFGDRIERREKADISLPLPLLSESTGRNQDAMVIECEIQSENVLGQASSTGDADDSIATPSSVQRISTQVVEDPIEVAKRLIFLELTSRLKSVYTGDYYCIESIGNPELRKRPPQIIPFAAMSKGRLLYAELNAKVSSMHTGHHHIVESPTIREPNVFNEHDATADSESVSTHKTRTLLMDEEVTSNLVSLALQAGSSGQVAKTEEKADYYSDCSQSDVQHVSNSCIDKHHDLCSNADEVDELDASNETPPEAGEYDVGPEHILNRESLVNSVMANPSEDSTNPLRILVDDIGDDAIISTAENSKDNLVAAENAGQNHECGDFRADMMSNIQAKPKSAESKKLSAEFHLEPYKAGNFARAVGCETDSLVGTMLLAEAPNQRDNPSTSTDNCTSGTQSRPNEVNAFSQSSESGGKELENERANQSIETSHTLHEQQMSSVTAATKSLTLLTGKLETSSLFEDSEKPMSNTVTAEQKDFLHSEICNKEDHNADSIFNAAMQASQPIKRAFSPLEMPHYLSTPLESKVETFETGNESVDNTGTRCEATESQRAENSLPASQVKEGKKIGLVVSTNLVESGDVTSSPGETNVYVCEKTTPQFTTVVQEIEQKPIALGLQTDLLGREDQIGTKEADNTEGNQYSDSDVVGFDPQCMLSMDAPHMGRRETAKGKKWKERLASKKACKGASSKMGSFDNRLELDESPPRESGHCKDMPDVSINPEQTVIQGLPPNKSKKWKDRLAAKKKERKCLPGNDTNGASGLYSQTSSQEERLELSRGIVDGVPLAEQIVASPSSESKLSGSAPSPRTGSSSKTKKWKDRLAKKRNVKGEVSSVIDHAVANDILPGSIISTTQLGEDEESSLNPESPGTGSVHYESKSLASHPVPEGNIIHKVVPSAGTDGDSNNESADIEDGLSDLNSDATTSGALFQSVLQKSLVSSPEVEPESCSDAVDGKPSQSELSPNATKPQIRDDLQNSLKVEPESCSEAVDGKPSQSELSPNATKTHIRGDLQNSLKTFDMTLSQSPTLPMDDESVWTEVTIGQETVEQVQQIVDAGPVDDVSYMEFTVDDIDQESYVEETVVSEFVFKQNSVPGNHGNKMSPFMTNLLSSRLYQDMAQQFPSNPNEKLGDHFDETSKAFPTILVDSIAYDDDMTQITMDHELYDDNGGDDDDEEECARIEAEESEGRAASDIRMDTFYDSAAKPATTHAMTPFVRMPSSKSRQSFQSQKSSVSGSSSSSQKSSETSKQRISDILKKDVWSQDIVVVQRAMDELSKQSKAGRKYRAHIARCGGIMAITRTMEMNSDDEAVQISCCETLEQLAKDPETQSAICEMDGIALIVRSMQDHADNVNLQEAACAALANVCRREEDEEIKLSMRNADGAVYTILTSMTRYPDNSRIQAKAFGAIANLSMESRERLAELSEAGGIMTMTLALQRPWQNKYEQYEAISSLSILLRGITELNAITSPGSVHEDSSLESDDDSSFWKSDVSEDDDNALMEVESEIPRNAVERTSRASNEKSGIPINVVEAGKRSEDSDRNDCCSSVDPGQDSEISKNEDYDVNSVNPSDTADNAESGNDARSAAEHHMPMEEKCVYPNDDDSLESLDAIPQMNTMYSDELGKEANHETRSSLSEDETIEKAIEKGTDEQCVIH